MAGHFKTVCRLCGTVVAQCRCMSAEKTITYVDGCEACPKDATKGKAAVYRIMPPQDHPLQVEQADTSFTQSFDAEVWAKAFVEHVRQNPRIASDEGTMIGWFANALMRGYDEHARRLRVAIEQVT